MTPISLPPITLALTAAGAADGLSGVTASSSAFLSVLNSQLVQPVALTEGAAGPSPELPQASLTDDAATIGRSSSTAPEPVVEAAVRPSIASIAVPVVAEPPAELAAPAVSISKLISIAISLNGRTPVPHRPHDVRAPRSPESGGDEMEAGTDANTAATAIQMPAVMIHDALAAAAASASASASPRPLAPSTDRTGAAQLASTAISIEPGSRSAHEPHATHLDQGAQNRPGATPETAPAASLSSQPRPDAFAQLLSQEGFLTPLDPRGSASPLAHYAAVDRPSLSAGDDLHQLDAIARDIAEVSGPAGRAAFRLAVQQLGALDVRLQATDSGVSVSIRAQNEQGQQTIAQAQQQLWDDMRSNGLKVASTSVMLGQGGAERQHDERAQAPRMAFVEAAASEREQQASNDQQRPSGRYA